MKISPVILLVLLTMLTVGPVYSQEPVSANIKTGSDTLLLKPDSLKGQKDLADIARRIFKKKTTKDPGSKKLHISAIPAAGYSLQTGWAGVFSTNLAFYTKSKPTADEKLSTVLASITYSQYNQIIFPLQANIWTKNNKYNIITDWRYLKYPSTTYGLGPDTKTTDGYTVDYSYIKLHQTILRNIYKDLYAGLGYYFDHFWNVKEIDPVAGVTTSFRKYGFSNNVTASGLAVKMLYDSRLNPINSTNGWYANIIFRQNFTFSGSDNNWQSMLVELRKYFHFPSSSKNVLAIWNYDWITPGGKPPYLLLPSTGWDDFYNTGRGYIQGRYRDNNMIYLESEYRFGISANGLFGAVIFVNGESFSQTLRKEFSVIAPGYGVGVRLKLNKYSDTNICVDYGFGNDHSRGIAVNLGEVF